MEKQIIVRSDVLKDLGPAAALVLGYLSQWEGKNFVKDAQHELGYANMAVYRAITKLEIYGFIEVNRNHDKKKLGLEIKLK